MLHPGVDEMTHMRPEQLQRKMLALAKHLQDFLLPEITINPMALSNATVLIRTSPTVDHTNTIWKKHGLTKATQLTMLLQHMTVSQASCRFQCIHTEVQCWQEAVRVKQ